MQDIPIRDIKPLVEIPDYSFYIFITIVIFTIVAILILAIYLFKFFKSKQKSKEREYLEILKNIDFKDPKESAYKITKYGRVLAKDERSREILNDLIVKLEKYKYQREVPKFDEESRKYYRLLLEVLNDK